MRVISQDGTKDFPYDSSWVSVYEGCINGRIYVRMQLCGGYDDSVNVADYSTKEKALKAIGMLREHNEGVIFLKTIINTEKCTPFVRSLSETDFDKLTQNYFQFPQDDEIEV
nr:MAG TPA: cytochrome c nitrite reductase subunit c552 [Bacteriophage sp.]